MRTFPSINQLRHVVDTVLHRARYMGHVDALGKPIYDNTRSLPKLTFKGLVKLHGTNAGLEFDLEGSVTAISKERVLTPHNDNFGFATRVSNGPIDIARLHQVLVDTTPESIKDKVVQWNAYGEWVGKIVNGKTAIGKLPARWVLFNVLYTLVDGTEVWRGVDAVADCWHELYPRSEWIFFISDYRDYEITIDFAVPEAALDQIEFLTLQVEADCPVARGMGGEPGLGEGIVWTLDDPVYGLLVFKSKGRLHKGTKNTRLVQIAPEVMESREAFVDAVLTESRLDQGFEILVGRHPRITLDHIGLFLKWIGQDIMKEESDTLKASGLERKDVMPLVMHAAKAWFLPKIPKV
ncbi:RNA ligase family protein [Comamonas thiooxydans]|uniref:RNA ligase family protein n=1 Tax=Comamonas thiooxydans TaxID=363952 RepID=UPI000B40E9BF|nr:RNA ligase family protein [Comamonas thiooxydans]